MYKEAENNLVKQQPLVFAANLRLACVELY